jgi:hypothetical protein
MASADTERRREPRVALALNCTLRRRIGAPISCNTVDLGMGGMSVASGRPLAQDERLSFELGTRDGAPLTGFATVLRQQAHRTYALRFEQLQEAARAALAELTGRVV